MATTRLMPLHSGKGRSVAQALGRVTDYVENPEKTNGGDWSQLTSAIQPSQIRNFFFLSGSTPSLPAGSGRTTT